MSDTNATQQVDSYQEKQLLKQIMSHRQVDQPDRQSQPSPSERWIPRTAEFSGVQCLCRL